MPCPSTLHSRELSLPDSLPEGSFLHKAVFNFYGEDKGKGVGDDVCVALSSGTTQGQGEPSRSFSGCWEAAARSSAVVFEILTS